MLNHPAPPRGLAHCKSTLGMIFLSPALPFTDPTVEPSMQKNDTPSPPKDKHLGELNALGPQNTGLWDV
jgi:hypothetical protein